MNNKMKLMMSSITKILSLRIHHYGVIRFGIQQADRYFNSFFKYFEIIAQRPYAFEAVDFIRPGYRRCVCGPDSIYFRIKDEIVEIMTIVGASGYRKLIGQIS
ncbi:type II toxin-antitoxin system RelE/ParE family toxin [Fulvivirga sp.]|uniref:type II toxin-antitoxin system RelE/ParE family toxin n=1 Tax=Fulvivirga sp. TaxID=1931237 RepID=UPI0032EBD675